MPAESDPAPPGLTDRDAATRCGISRQQIGEWRRAGKLGPDTRPGHIDPATLDAWFATQRVQETPGASERRGGRPRGSTIAAGAKRPATGPTLLELQQRKLDVQIRTRELDLSIRTAEHVRRDAARAAILDMGAMVVHTVGAFPPREAATLAARLGADQRVVLAELEGIARRILEKLAGVAAAAAERV